MSIRPVDLQVLVPKSTELNNQNVNTKAEFFQQHMAQELTKHDENAKQVVIETNKSDEKNKIDKDGKNSNGQSSKKKNRNRSLKQEEEHEEEKKRGSMSMFDITI